MAVSRRSVRSREEEEDDEVDEEPEERPRRRRPRDEEPEDEERPAKRKRRPRDEDDDEDDEPPKRRRRARSEDADEEEERPRKSRRRARDDDDEDEDDDERPKRPVGSVRKGWKGHKENKEKGGDYPDELKVTNQPELVKFLQDEPFVSYRQHWVDNPPNGIRKKSWTCLEDKCPLCDLGDRPRTLTSFNVLHISTGADPENKILVLGNKAVGQLEGFASDPKTGPLDRLYWAISKSGKNQQTAYNFRPVKERDLEEDWDIEPEEVEEFIEDAMDRLYDHTSVQVPSRKQLKEIASGLTDDDDDDYEDD